MLGFAYPGLLQTSVILSLKYFLPFALALPPHLVWNIWFLQRQGTKEGEVTCSCQNLIEYIVYNPETHVSPSKMLVRRT